MRAETPDPTNHREATPVVCRVCGSKRCEVVGSKRGKLVPELFEFWRCQVCSFLFVEPVLPGDLVYTAEYYEGKGADPSIDYASEYANWRTSSRRAEIEDLIGIAERHISSTAQHADIITWLDLGCGSGTLLRALRERGNLSTAMGSVAIDAFGVDDGSFAEILRSDGFRILDVRQIPDIPDDSVDVVTCIEVIEHIDRPTEAIRDIARVLRRGGICILTTANFDSPIAKVLGHRLSYCIPEIHVSLLNSNLLASMYHAAGLSPLAVRYNGVVEFKLAKNLELYLRNRGVARALARVKVLRSLVDWLYGVSTMPCATKQN